MNKKEVITTMGIIAAVFGFIAACITIYGFVTGNLSLSSIFNQPQNSPTAQTQKGQTPIITTPIAHNNENTGSTGSQTTAQGLWVVDVINNLHYYNMILVLASGSVAGVWGL